MLREARPTEGGRMGTTVTWGTRRVTDVLVARHPGITQKRLVAMLGMDPLQASMHLQASPLVMHLVWFSQGTGWYPRDWTVPAWAQGMVHGMVQRLWETSDAVLRTQRG